jgi:hypothetical protein
MQSLLAAVNTILGIVQQRYRRAIIIIDGLDRIRDFARAKSLFLESEMIAQLACRLVVCGPFALRSHPATSAIPRFSKVTVLVNEPVMKKHAPKEYGPGVPFFCDLYRRRVADMDVAGLIPQETLDLLAYSSGGRARDFVKLIRSLAERGWLKDAASATPEIVDAVIDEARRLIETGLDAGHDEVLAQAVRNPQQLPAGEAARELLSYGHLLPYPNEAEWYYPHPLLLKRLERLQRASSSG